MKKNSGKEASLLEPITAKHVRTFFYDVLQYITEEGTEVEFLHASGKKYAIREVK